MHFAIGYSEPEAGTDLASLRTTAVRHGDEYIVNGQKIWTTGGHDADYVWLACRTDPDAAKHKGISILIVDTKDPGYSWTPIILSDGAHHTNATYYNDVRVPVDMLVGEENDGWRLITTQLNHERVMLGPAGRVAGSTTGCTRGRRSRAATASPRSTTTTCARLLGEIKAIWRINELLNWQVAAAGETIDVADAAATKVFAHRAHSARRPAGRGDRRQVRQPGRPGDRRTAGLAGQRRPSATWCITFGGGVNEVMREHDRGGGPEGAAGAAVSARRATSQAAAERVKAEGKSKPRAGRHPVNQPMIDHWLDAIGDKNPIYVDEAAAKAAGHPGIVAPPAMIQVWTMTGLGGVRPDDDPLGKILELFDERRLHRRRRHQLRADLPPLPASR